MKYSIKPIHISFDIFQLKRYYKRHDSCMQFIANSLYNQLHFSVPPISMQGRKASESISRTIFPSWKLIWEYGARMIASLCFKWRFVEDEIFPSSYETWQWRWWKSLRIVFIYKNHGVSQGMSMNVKRKPIYKVFGTWDEWIQLNNR